MALLRGGRCDFGGIGPHAYERSLRRPGTVGTAAAKAPPSTRLGRPANPLVLTCADESFPGAPSSPVPQTPQRGDLVVGPLFIVEGKVLADAGPAGYGEHGRYKVPIIVKMGRTVTMTIAPPARGEVVIDNPYSPVGGVVSATYHSCANEAGFFAQGNTDRKSTRLNSSHLVISYAVFCVKRKLKLPCNLVCLLIYNEYNLTSLT